ncbi:MAG: orotidine 5'-phosphate decarboxylase, partial [Actinobacteria bacterium]|nr:orotidine 5'-phosphate decarboxylase [Actinomycetota bacterium]
QLIDNEPLYKHVARAAANTWQHMGDTALVVGATYPAELAEVRAIVGDMPLLVPGIGAQGGDINAVVRNGSNSSGLGLIINSSRAVLYASNDAQFAQSARGVALATRDAIRAASN